MKKLGQVVRVMHKPGVGYALLYRSGPLKWSGPLTSVWMGRHEDGEPFTTAGPEAWEDDGWTEVPNPESLSVHPCASCDTPMMGDDYLCPECRSAMLP